MAGKTSVKAGKSPSAAKKAKPAAKAGKPAAKRAKPAATSDKPRRSYMPAEERRDSIVQAAREVFSRTNLQGARTRDLAKAAGVNQATLYGHFESKEELFVEAVVQPLVDAMRGMYERASSYENAENTEEFLGVAKASVRNHLESMVEIYPLLTSALFSDPELGRKLYLDHMAPLFKERGKAMANAVRDDIDPDMLALLAFGMFFAVAMDRHFRGGKTKIADIAEQVTAFSTFGLARDRFRE